MGGHEPQPAAHGRGAHHQKRPTYITHGWAYGSRSGYKVGGKKVALAITAGIDEEEFATDEKYKYPLAELTRSFELSFEYIKADCQPMFAYYGLEYHVDEAWIEKSVPKYLEYLDSL